MELVDPTLAEQQIAAAAPGEIVGAGATAQVVDAAPSRQAIGGRPADEGVATASADQGITPDAAVELVGPAAADQPVGPLLALEPVGAPAALEHVLAPTSAQGVGAVTTSQDVVVILALDQVRTAASVEGVLVAATHQHVVQRITGPACGRRCCVHLQILDEGGERVVDESEHPVGTRVRLLDHLVAGLPHEIPVVAGAAAHHVGVGATADGVVADLAVKHVPAGAAAHDVVAGAGEHDVDPMIEHQPIVERAAERAQRLPSVEVRELVGRQIHDGAEADRVEPGQREAQVVIRLADDHPAESALQYGVDVREIEASEDGELEALGGANDELRRGRRDERRGVDVDIIEERRVLGVDWEVAEPEGCGHRISPAVTGQLAG